MTSRKGIGTVEFDGRLKIARGRAVTAVKAAI